MHLAEMLTLVEVLTIKIFQKIKIVITHCCPQELPVSRCLDLRNSIHEGILPAFSQHCDCAGLVFWLTDQLAPPAGKLKKRFTATARTEQTLDMDRTF